MSPTIRTQKAVATKAKSTQVLDEFQNVADPKTTRPTRKALTSE
jgi:hypothetical protein